MPLLHSVDTLTSDIIYNIIIVLLIEDAFNACFRLLESSLRHCKD